MEKIQIPVNKDKLAKGKRKKPDTLLPPTSSSYLVKLVEIFLHLAETFLPIWTEEIFSPHSRCWCQGLLSWPS